MHLTFDPKTLRGIYECRPVHQAIARSVLGSTDVLYVHVSWRDLCISESGEVNIMPKHVACILKSKLAPTGCVIATDIATERLISGNFTSPSPVRCFSPYKPMCLLTWLNSFGYSQFQLHSNIASSVGFHGDCVLQIWDSWKMPLQLLAYSGLWFV